KEKSNEEITQYVADHKLEKVSVEDVLKADAGKFDSSDFNLYDDKISPSMSSAEEKKEDNN
ncbi:MAG: hypothetical protein Q8S39_03190, partial [Ignavibacteria bacterium]|nr:hypothetical protein [Ignavibacteria bacterium]